MWASGLPSGSFLVHGTLRQHGAHYGSGGSCTCPGAIQKSQRLCAGSGQEGNKLASFPEPLCACVLIVKKATAPGVEEDLCVPSL